ncbi:MAG: hypothetical protein CI953_179 [Methanohalophilus sp.]|nr:MAG: hypothetical protein CI953_179 [Methanohalophilus sp.]
MIVIYNIKYNNFAYLLYLMKILLFKNFVRRYFCAFDII